MRQLFVPPHFEDEGQRRIARHLNVILLTCAIAAGLVALISFQAALYNTALGMLAGLTIVLASFVLFRLRHLQFASLLLLSALLVLMTLLAYIGQGVHDLAMVVYPITLIMASLLLKRGWFVLFTLLTIAATSLIVFVEIQGTIQTDFGPPLTSWTDLVMMATILSVTAVAMRLLTDDLTRSLDRAHHNERALAETNQALAHKATALRASEARWRSLVQNAPNLILLLDHNGAIQFINNIGHAIREEVVGQPIYRFVVPEQKALLERAITSVLHSGDATRCQVQGLLDEEILGWFEVQVSPIQQDDQAPSSIMVIATNINARKRAEAEREALIAELEAKNTELEKFTYTVSHDLKSPLITIRGFLGFVDQDLSEGRLDQARDDLGRINAATQQMQLLLDDLLTLSRIGRKMNPPAPAPFGELVAEALDQVEGAFTTRGMTCKVQPALPMVYGDRLRFVELLQNLLENAVKFSGDRPDPLVEVGLRTDADGPVFFVRDNGIGIEPQYCERMFGLFERLSAETEGTGIGLALVQRIVALHGGRVWIESEGLGSGTTVCFTLPLWFNPAATGPEAQGAAQRTALKRPGPLTGERDVDQQPTRAPGR